MVADSRLEKAKLMKTVRSFQSTLSADAKAQTRVKAVNTLLNSGYNLKSLDDKELETVWDALFFALWYAEMGGGCEEIIAAIERACSTNYRLTRVGFQTIAKKWYALDHHRVDKVSHLARHLLPILLEQQISLWFRKYKANRNLGTRDVPCKPILKKTLHDVMDSYGLCYFLLEILGEEITKTLTTVYDRLDITTGKFELKANLLIFLYKQIIHLAANMKLDARLLRTFDQYVIKRLVEDVLPNESQLTQILVSLRLYQALDKCVKKTKKHSSGKCKALLERWSKIVKEVHENCINGEYFPTSSVPVQGTIRLGVRY